MTILQNIVGPESEELAALTRERHAAMHPLQTRYYSQPEGRRAVWGKIVAVRKWLEQAHEGETALLLDADAVLMRAILDGEFPEPAELGMVMARHEDLRWLNSGVMFLRNSERLRDFFQFVWKLGPQPARAGCPEGGDQGAINHVLCSFGLNMAIMPNRYNAYTFAPCDAPVIAAFHGMPHAEKVRHLREVVS